ncbi:MAG: hypothetical protein KIS81_10820 [Maricaulaceae bacterium]|nr:hypothetical protein [Maricaulaceae bacterium]
MIGVCIVFLLSDEWGEFLARRVVEQIEKHTTGPYQIYGYALRATKEQISLLSSLNINLLRIPSLPEKSTNHVSREHSSLLDHLVSHAFDDGCSFVATFDMDSWPVMTGWDKLYPSMISDSAPVVTIVRTELTDNFPFAAFTLFSSSFWQNDRSSFATDPVGSISRRPNETGSGILDQLARDGKSFFRLERTNDWNPHPIMAGLYDDAIFHLGSGSRAPVFVTDGKQYNLNKSQVRRNFANDMNAASRISILSALTHYHDDFISELAGGSLDQFIPILSLAAQTPKSLQLTPRVKRSRLMYPSI